MSEASTAKKLGRAFYKHIMNGVLRMLPFITGGGIMCAIAFLVDTIMGYTAYAGIGFGSMTPVSEFLSTAGSLVMGLSVAVLSGFTAESIAGREALVSGFAGGLLATYGSTASGFLGGIIAGFVAGGVVILLKKLFCRIPQNLESLLTFLVYPVLGTLAMSAVMWWVLNPVVSVINGWITMGLAALGNAAGYTAVFGLVLGGLMSIDMGGPINKTTYIFGTGMLATASELLANGHSLSDPAVQSCYIGMASIMAGSMAYPVGVALACWLFPRKFTKSEKNTRIANLIMGASFITEGVIPFAAADPARVIPASFAGGCVSGLLSAVFGCTLMAPDGGIFVIATIGNPGFYILAWLAGVAVTAILLGILKKTLPNE